MDSASLYDLSPALRLMIAGILIACGPLLWIWMRNRNASLPRRLQALTVLTLFLTFDLTLFGAFTRLTDSGLGCPDWPGCYGKASPAGAHADIAAAQAALPSGPVTHGKAWIEMIHRYLATGVGVLILTLAVATWVAVRRQRRAARPAAAAGGGRAPDGLQAVPLSPWWPTATLFWVCLQGAFGALTVTMKLFPAIVTLHLAGAVVLLALLCVQASRYSRAATGRLPAAVGPGLRALVLLALAMVAMQILLGGWVSTNYAVLACNTFPTCQGRWWPEMDFSQGFQVWRELGLLRDGSSIGFAGLTAIHYAHRLFAYAVFAVLGLLAWRLRAVPALRRTGGWVGGLALWQFATGLSNVVLDWPLAAAVSHTGGAAALVVALTWAACESRAARPAASAAGPFRDGGRAGAASPTTVSSPLP
ncbi:MAG: COX15/CtaA family protein [Xylophilus ampelinus]